MGYTIRTATHRHAMGCVEWLEPTAALVKARWPDLGGARRRSNPPLSGNSPGANQLRSATSDWGGTLPRVGSCTITRATMASILTHSRTRIATPLSRSLPLHCVHSFTRPLLTLVRRHEQSCWAERCLCQRYCQKWAARACMAARPVRLARGARPCGCAARDTEKNLPAMRRSPRPTTHQSIPYRRIRSCI